MDFIRNAMFEAVVKQIYGQDNVPQTRVCLPVVFVHPFCAFKCVTVMGYVHSFSLLPFVYEFITSISTKP